MIIKNFLNRRLYFYGCRISKYGAILSSNELGMVVGGGAALP